MESEESICNLGCAYTNSNPLGSRDIATRRFREFFGVSPLVGSRIWNRLTERNVLPPNATPCQMLCGLLLLKSYPTEAVCHVLMKVDETTFRQWAWSFIDLMADQLKMVLPFLRLFVFLLFPQPLYPPTLFSFIFYRLILKRAC
jgi:hypothetical protein